MSELIHGRVVDLKDTAGHSYRRALVYADREAGGTWVAWIEFVSAAGERVLQTEPETTQGSLEAVASWASGLRPRDFEAALARARRRDLGPGAAAGNAGMVALRLRTADATVAQRVMDTRMLIPGTRRHLAEGGVIIYVRALEPALTEMPRIYELLAQYRSDADVESIAAALEEDLHGSGAALEVRRVEVPIDRAMIALALRR
jgi:hypothetical protein